MHFVMECAYANKGEESTSEEDAYAQRGLGPWNLSCLNFIADQINPKYSTP